jgi:hypothetical protein
MSAWVLGVGVVMDRINLSWSCLLAAAAPN